MSKEINGTSKAAVALSIKNAERFGSEEFVAFLQEETLLLDQLIKGRLTFRRLVGVTQREV